MMSYIDLEVRMRLLKSHTRSTVLYVNESWSIEAPEKEDWKG